MKSFSAAALAGASCLSFALQLLPSQRCADEVLHAAGKVPMLTIGGWSGSVYFSDLVSTSKKRAAFANTIKTWMRTYGFKGVDLDWEFSASPCPPSGSVPRSTTDSLFARSQSAVKARATTSSRRPTRPTTCRSSPSCARRSAPTCTSRPPSPPRASRVRAAPSSPTCPSSRPTSTGSSS